MSAGSRFPRRDLFAGAFRAFAALAAARALGVAQVFEPAGFAARTAPASGPASGKVRFQRYRVQAAVSLFGVPVVWKDGIGAAALLVEEAETEAAAATAIQFVSGSWPERVKGFNRFGMTQEVVREESGTLRESAYLSFMTSSPEKNSDQAWRAFADRPHNLMLAVASGVASASGYHWSLDHQSIPNNATWLNGPQLMENFRAQDASSRGNAQPLAKDCVYPTFLYSVRKALLERSTATRTFIHNAKLFDLHPRFSKADDASLLTGRIVENGSSSESEFRVWFDGTDPAALPSKIEFRPRSFLHLTFHLDPAAGGPHVRRLLIHDEV